jgi:hypothetical protein
MLKNLVPFLTLFEKSVEIDHFSIIGKLDTLMPPLYSGSFVSQPFI